MAKYRLKRGHHSEGGIRYHFKRNPIVESGSNLVQKFGSEKFERIDGEEVFVPRQTRHLQSDARDQEELAGGTSQADDGLDSMTVAQLKEYAENEEIDLGDATRKDDIVAAIRLSQEE